MGDPQVFQRLIVVALILAASAMAAPVTAQEVGYTVKPGDTLTISVWKEPELQGAVLVTPDGAFTFPLVGQVDARGKTVTELQRIVSERLQQYISDPVVTVSVQDSKGNKVYVIGQVNRPGEFIVNPRVDVMQALSMAGGTTAFASLGNIIILRRAGGQQQALRFDYTNVVRGRNLEQNIDLIAGDVVVVP
jgi:polysaccharide biosynthesis/export protein